MEILPNEFFALRKDLGDVDEHLRCSVLVAMLTAYDEHSEF